MTTKKIQVYQWSLKVRPRTNTIKDYKSRVFEHSVLEILRNSVFFQNIKINENAYPRTDKEILNSTAKLLILFKRLL